MKRGFGVIFWCALFLFGVTANSFADLSSEELLQILKEKGVISGQDIEKAEQSKKKETIVKAYRKPGSFEIAGRVQFRYMHMENDTDHNLVTNQKAFDDPEFDGFVLRRVRLRVRGDITDNWSYHVQASCDGAENSDKTVDTTGKATSDDTGFKLQDAEINYHINPYLNIHMGQFKTRFSTAYLAAGPNLPLCERALVIDNLSPMRDIGISIESSKGGVFDGRDHGKTVTDKPVYYALGIYNGNGMNHMRNDNDHYMYMGKLQLRPCKHFNIGASYARNKKTTVSASDSTDEDIDYWDFNTALDIGMAHVQAEYISKQVDGDADASGYGVQAQFDVLDNFQLTCRYDELDPNDTVDDEEDSQWYTVGYNWFIHGQKVKWQLNYTFREEMHGKDVNNDVLITHFQVLF